MKNESRRTQREMQTQPAADPQPQVIQDLDVTADDTPDIVGGGCPISKATRGGAAPSPLPLPYPN